jgi:glucosamine-6-phosphate deaminase
MNTTRERIPVSIFEEDEEINSVVASRIAAIIRERADEGKPAVLGLATGSSPVGVYSELIRLHREQGLSFQNVITFNLDEYFPMDPDSIHSYHRYMREHLLDHVDIPDANIHILRGELTPEECAEHCSAFERRIAEAGGIDLQLLGIGRSGHIGFNEPGSGRESRTRLIFLDTITRADAAADFFGEQNVPLEAVTMGVATILEAREIALIATGEHKAGIIRRAVEGEVDSDVAATFLQMHPNAVVYLDTAAAADLTRVATPWLVGEVEWDSNREVEAVTWLAERVERSVLRLATADYRDHHLSSLLARHGTAEPLNGLVFNTLIAKIRGRAKLPKDKRVVVFSPHPDDDVISMGGTLAKLHQNGNHITVAYQTSGNIAVFDHEVRRYLELLTRIADGFPVVAGGAHKFEQRIDEALTGKKPGDVDEPDVLTLKRLIRETEATSALETFGMSAEQARFLNLPFYQTGAVKKKPIGDDDVAIVSEVFDEVEPDLVFAAGDLSDPHGTHRLCLEAVRRALEIYRGPAPEVWLYRGAWHEWPVSEASVLVPMSQADLRLKILAIYRHQSQKDEAPFPGHDPREFWERVEDRNQALAAELERLGLPAYYAMEAFVVERDGERLENPVVPTSSLADRDG